MEREFSVSRIRLFAALPIAVGAPLLARQQSSGHR
ncbi:hypothetical protein ACP70R_013559 [Stipagrostis hirtigluma subsp. patula]